MKTGPAQTENATPCLPKTWISQQPLYPEFGNNVNVSIFLGQNRPK
jgi:hypothetical protein